MRKIKTVFIVGPTASGKTGLGIKLAQSFNGEIISADSMQIYKGIHIASACPDKEEMQGIPHHLLEFLEVDEEYSVAEYVKEAFKCIEDIEKRGRLPIVVGGTGLYISSLLDNIAFLEEESDGKLRKALTEELEAVGGEEMLKRLAQFDPQTAARLHPNNKRRIIRAFEVYRQTGKTFTEQNELSRLNESPLEPLVIGINYRYRESLYARINERIDKMLKNGLIEEAEKTLLLCNNKGCFQAIGHKELYPYLKGEADLDTAAESLKQQTRRYAKRQLTWFRREDRVNWIYADDENFLSKAEITVKEFLKEEAH